MTENALPQPDVEELQQEDTATIAVPVRHDGPVTMHELPSRVGAVIDFALTTTMQMVVPANWNRKRTLLISSAAWNISHSRNSAGSPWPAGVPCEIRHCSAIWASGTATLTVVTEVWAD
jgi:hypothetical protein